PIVTVQTGIDQVASQYAERRFGESAGGRSQEFATLWVIVHIAGPKKGKRPILACRGKSQCIGRRPIVPYYIVITGTGREILQLGKKATRIAIVTQLPIFQNCVIGLCR